MRREVKNENGVKMTLVLTNGNQVQVEVEKAGKIAAISKLQKANSSLKKSQKWEGKFDYYLSGYGFFIPVQPATANYLLGEIAHFEQEALTSSDYFANENRARTSGEQAEETLRVEREMVQAGFSTGFEMVDKLHDFDGSKF